MRTRPIRSPALNAMPRNEKVAEAPAMFGTEKTPSGLSARSKSEIVVAFVSTSEKTAPKAETEAGVAPPVPGIENVMSVTLLPTGVKIRGELKAAKVVA